MKYLRHVYIQVLLAIALGFLIGHFFPSTGIALKPLGDGFIRLVRLIAPPIVFLTIVCGASHMGDMKTVGKIAGKAILYFEVVTTIALLIGLGFVNVLQPGSYLSVKTGSVNTSALAQYKVGDPASQGGIVDFILGIIPTSIVEALAKGEMLQIVFFACLFAVAIAHLGVKGQNLLGIFEDLLQAFFKLVAMIMRLAPIGAFGAMAFTAGKYGFGTLHSLAMLLVTVYGATIFFIVVVLGLICRFSGFSIFRLLAYVKDEIFIVLATCSSEAAFPQLIQKLQRAGCSKRVTGLVLPIGYSFNLDGTCIAQVICAVFIAQAFNVPLTGLDQLTLILVSMLTSKGSAGVAGASFVALLATLTTFKQIPIEGAALVLGVDRFISEVRATTNMIGNAVATFFVARWENDRDDAMLRDALGMTPGHSAVADIYDEPLDDLGVVKDAGELAVASDGGNAATGGRLVATTSEPAVTKSILPH